MSDSAKARRNRRNVLNILVTILSWLVEFFGSFSVFLGSFIFGHDNSIITLSLQTMTMLIYFIILPLTFLVNKVKKIGRKNSSRSHPHPRRRWPSLSRHTSRGPAHAGASRPTLTSLQPGVIDVVGGALMARRRSPEAARSVVRRRCTVPVDAAQRAVSCRVRGLSALAKRVCARQE